MTKVQAEFHNPTGEWQPASPEVDGLWEQVLSGTSGSDDHTRLLRFDPGTNTTAAGVLYHDFFEEVFIISGALTDLSLDATFSKGMYCCRHPGMPHGPYRSDSGCLLVEFRYSRAP